ncbi:MAG: hypothetical protein ACLVJR_00005, partial [Negativibacillus sp.]
MQTSTTTDKVSLPRRWMQPTAVMLWVLIWQLAAMAVNIPLLLPSPVAVLQRLWQLCGEGEFWYTVDLPVPHPAGLCRRGGSR